MVQTTIDQGIIPVLRPSPPAPTTSHRATIQRHHPGYRPGGGHPGDHLWRAARGLPEGGLQEDDFHLTAREDNFISFAGDEHVYTQTLRNLLSLLTLETLRQNVLSG